jgi:hypothetical protein
MHVEGIIQTKRILGRQIGRELDRTELDLVAGGLDSPDMVLDGDCGCGTDKVPHAGTCSRESDCD